MGKKKRFIKKNQCVKFTLVDKSHEDPSGFDTNNVRVWHAAESKKKEEQIACGIFFDDDYDYLQHVRDRFGAEVQNSDQVVPIWEAVEEGQFDDVASVRGSVKTKSDIFGDGDFPSLLAIENASDYNAMAASAQDKPGPHWDPDIAATMDDEFADFCDDLEDDFVNLAGGVFDPEYEAEFPEISAYNPEENEDEEEEDSRGVTTGVRDHDWRDVLEEVAEDSDAELPFHDSQELEDRRRILMDAKSQRSRFTEYSLTSSAVPRSEYQTDLDDHFETMYGEYDDLEVGALDHEEVEGHIGVNHPSVLFALGIKDGDTSDEVPKNPLDDDDPEFKITLEDLRLDQLSDSDVDSDDLFPESPKKPEFDCESILSTYSNIYNRPKEILVEKKVKLNQFGVPKIEKENEEKPLPKEDLTEFDRLKWIPPNVRRRDETKEETRARQKIQKEEQRLRRLEKKNNKIAFKMEEIRQQRAEINKRRSTGIKF